MSPYPSLCVFVGGSAAFAASQDGCLDNLLVVRDVAALAKTSDHQSAGFLGNTPKVCAAETLTFPGTILLFVLPLPCA